MLRYDLFVRNVDYDKIYRTSLEVIEGLFNTKDNIKDNTLILFYSVLRMLKRLAEHNKQKGDCIHDENQYLHLINDILEHGDMVEGRNGFAKTVIGSAMHFSLENGKIPILTTKKVAWKTCLKELLWFIRGSTSNKELQAENVKIWNGNASREFLDSRNLHHLAENDLGPVYGHQWRHFNAYYKTCDDDYSGEGVDQLQYIIDNLKNPETRTSRRLVMSAWNPAQLDEMSLPPCHVLVQFNVTDKNKLSCSLYQRSGDVGLGVPFNIASYSFLTHIIAKHCDLSMSSSVTRCLIVILITFISEKYKLLNIINIICDYIYPLNDS